MSNPKHTPEPWPEKPSRLNLHDTPPYISDRMGCIQISLENYAHARACVNALAGLNPEAVADVIGLLTRNGKESPKTLDSSNVRTIMRSMEETLVLTYFTRPSRQFPNLVTVFRDDTTSPSGASRITRVDPKLSDHAGDVTRIVLGHARGYVRALGAAAANVRIWVGYADPVKRFVVQGEAGR